MAKALNATIAASLLLLTGCSGEPERPWTPYSKRLDSGATRFWLANYETRKDCLMETSRAVALYPEQGHPAESAHCAYSGNSRLLTFALNHFHVGRDLHCISRLTGEKVWARYQPVLKVSRQTDQGEGWYCTSVIDF